MESLYEEISQLIADLDQAHMFEVKGKCMQLLIRIT